jgi:hypothetical protein
MIQSITGYPRRDPRRSLIWWDRFAGERDEADGGEGESWKRGKSNEKMFIESIARRSEARPCASKGLAAMWRRKDAPARAKGATRGLCAGRAMQSAQIGSVRRTEGDPRRSSRSSPIFAILADPGGESPRETVPPIARATGRASSALTEIVERSGGGSGEPRETTASTRPPGFTRFGGAEESRSWKRALVSAGRRKRASRRSSLLLAALSRDWKGNSLSDFLLAIAAETAVVGGFQVITINLAGRIENRPEMCARTRAYTVKKMKSGEERRDGERRKEERRTASIEVARKCTKTPGRFGGLMCWKRRQGGLLMIQRCSIYATGARKKQETRKRVSDATSNRYRGRVFRWS